MSTTTTKTIAGKTITAESAARLERYDRMVADARAALAEAKDEYAAADSELIEALDHSHDSYYDIDAARERMADAERRLAEAKSDLEYAFSDRLDFIDNWAEYVDEDTTTTATTSKKATKTTKRYFYAAFHNRARRFDNDIDYIVRFGTKAERDEYVNGEELGMDSEYHHESITAAQARKLAPHAFTVIGHGFHDANDWVDDGFPGEFFTLVAC